MVVLILLQDILGKNLHLIYLRSSKIVLNVYLFFTREYKINIISEVFHVLNIGNFKCVLFLILPNPYLHL